MEHYAFVRSLMAWMASIACLFPVTVPLLYLAFRVREGWLPEDDENRMENDELRKRSILAGAVLAAVTFAFLFVDVVFAQWALFPAGAVHFAVFLCYVPAAAFVLTYYFGFEDFFAGLAILTIFLIVPLLVLFPINYFLGLWSPVLGWFEGFLKIVS